MFKSTELFELLGFKQSTNTLGVITFERKDGVKLERITFNTTYSQYRYHLYIAGREVPYEWIDYPIHNAVSQFIIERQFWK
jgi:hypothetical protein